MEISGFNQNNISEQNKEALKSETWQTVRKAMKTEVQHFTEAPEIQHFAIEKVSKNDNVYGVVWGNVVMEYLKTAYSEKNAQADVVSDGITYKVLKDSKPSLLLEMVKDLNNTSPSEFVIKQSCLSLATSIPT